MSILAFIAVGFDLGVALYFMNCAVRTLNEEINKPRRAVIVDLVRKREPPVPTPKKMEEGKKPKKTVEIVEHPLEIKIEK